MAPLLVNKRPGGGKRRVPKCSSQAPPPRHLSPPGREEPPAAGLRRAASRTVEPRCAGSLREASRGDADFGVGFPAQERLFPPVGPRFDVTWRRRLHVPGECPGEFLPLVSGSAMSQAPRSSPAGRRERRPRNSPDDRTWSGANQRARDREVRVERQESKCSHVCSRRGIVLIVTVLTNALVLICVVAAQMVVSGMTSMGGLGGFDINANLQLQGTELQQVRDLDMQYSQMRAPGIYGGVAFSLTMGVVSLLFVVAGNKPPHLMSRGLLVGALAFQAAGAAAYVVAVGLYLHFIIGVNATDVCQRRERIYARNGYTWMNCDVSGADAAVALFGIITAILYACGAGLTLATIRQVKRYLQKSRQQREPLGAATTSV
ncbi:MARVEL domain-containing protein 3 [Synchiropus splendidus]|uniref:MARVEL domain-containing protein 3 n=1 Tax=Synchiropus splendidus TaxID=270530 RepID=UPI00237EE0CC|nr:MARVEL domain-containing protein 3 [Synchiropus splendidus]